jgi:hypothetical protein
MMNTKSISTGLARHDDPLDAADSPWSMRALTRSARAVQAHLLARVFNPVLSLVVPRPADVKQLGVRPSRRLDARDR